MPLSFPKSPKVLKGALVVFDSQFLAGAPNIIVFQYNPVQLGRTLTRRTPASDATSAGGVREDVLRVQGPPVEEIRLTVELDATDQLAEPRRFPVIVDRGLLPALSALELLLHPPSSQQRLQRLRARGGSVQICPADLPLVLFVWGASRVLPVRLDDLSITEEAFNPHLNPIRAKVDLNLRVLTSMELKDNSLGYAAYKAMQTQKETLARLNTASAAAQVTGLLPF